MRPLGIKVPPLLDSPLISARPLLSRSLPLRFRPPRLRAWSKLRIGLFADSPTCCCGVARAATMGAARVAVKSKIDLTEKEEMIFQRLLDVVRHFKMETELRVAGGWVRDKLLGRDCYDIDIALDKMLGREFCEKVNEFLALKGEKTRGVGVIQSNPDQSKHLETARMHIYDTWIDFVNLRSETYAENSRIPTMMFGTAEEDAYRRDLTINSLFYNINKKIIEDFTGRGVEDLKRGIIITPLPPMATFLDDPLRVLRAIRFGARFGFTLDEDLKKAAADEEVKNAIANKISKERIGHEIDSMMSDNEPVKAMTYLCELKLFWVVFSPPHNSEPAVMEETERLCIEYMDAAWNLLHSLGHSMFDDVHRRLCLYGALLLPLRKLTYKDRKSKEIPVSSHIIKNSLKLKASDAETVVMLHSILEKVVSLITFLQPSETSTTTETDMEDEYLDVPHASKRRILAGLFLRRVKDFWPVAFLLSTLLYPQDVEGFLAKNFQVDPAREFFMRIRGTIITELDLDKVWEMKPLVKGDDIMDALQLKGGPQIREWQERLIKWQLAHPQAEKEEALDWIRSLHAKRAKLN